MEQYGASIGTVIAEITVTAVQIYFVRHDFKFKEILKNGRNYLFASVIMFIVCIIIENLLEPGLIALFVIVGVRSSRLCSNINNIER